MTVVVKDKLAFEADESGYRFTAWYLTEPEGDALVEITKDGRMVRKFLWPSYKVWNIAAHARDIAQSLDAEDHHGFVVAGSDGLGGGVSPRDVEPPPVA